MKIDQIYDSSNQLLTKFMIIESPCDPKGQAQKVRLGKQ